MTTNRDGSERVDDFSAPNSIPGSEAQEMELQAVVEALKLALTFRAPVELDRFEKVEIYSDSLYVCDNFDRAVYEWSRQGWRRSSGAPLMNLRLWQELVRLRARVGKPVYITKIERRSSPHAKAVDRLAKEAARRALTRPQKIQSPRRTWTEKPVEPGSVPVEGQEIEIRITNIEPTIRPRGFRLTYEVVSGPHEGRRDRLFWDQALRQRNIYLVRLNNQPHYPRIVEVLDELPASAHPANPALDDDGSATGS